ncbi:hypothetical protein F5144DRAFT_559036 [Chaetomium tenue]|uniref:Uncharacterized protein n=1 Tax=Chaetomium tenue TaxID=1854479 RepID=A0ACB7PQ03_9PEZI|nr:hypothetical protein F5144DRAFT_559036 [Chaetomium globosum]
MTTYHAGHGDCNIIDFCQVPPSEATQRNVKDVWRRVLIDTGFHKKEGAVAEGIYGALVNRAVPLYKPSSSPNTIPDVPSLREMQITHFDADHIGNAGKVLEILEDQGIFDEWQRRDETYKCDVTCVDIPALWPTLCVTFDGAAKEGNGAWAVTFLITGLHSWKTNMSGIRFYQHAECTWSHILDSDGEPVETGDWIDPTSDDDTSKLKITWDQRLLARYRKKEDPELTATLQIDLSLFEGDRIDIGKVVDSNHHMLYDFKFEVAKIYNQALQSILQNAFNTDGPTSAKKARRGLECLYSGGNEGVQVLPDEDVHKRLYQILVDQVELLEDVVDFVPPQVGARVSIPGYKAENEDGHLQQYAAQSVVSPNHSMQSDLKRYMVADILANGQNDGGGDVEIDIRSVILNRASIVTIFNRPSRHLPKGYDPEGGFRMLFTGDAYDQGCDIRRTIYSWQQTKPLPPLWLSVLKIPHHGSSVTAYSDFYEFVRAEVYIICANHEHTSANPRYSSLRAIIQGFSTSGPNDFYRARPSGEPFRIFMSNPAAEKDIEDNKGKITRTSAIREIVNSVSYMPGAACNYEVWRLNPRANQRGIARGAKSTPYGSIVFYRDTNGAMREFFDPLEWECIAKPRSQTPSRGR